VPSMRDIPALADREELETTHMDARTPLQPAVVTPKQGLSIKPFGLDMDVLLTTEATGGATSVIVAWHKPGEGPPDHVHFKQEEFLFIIEGFYEVTVGDETATAGPGSIVFIPRNVVHRFKNVGDITGRMLGCSLPGGQDHYLKAISELAAGGDFTSEKVMEISKTFDTHFFWSVRSHKRPQNAGVVYPAATALRYFLPQILALRHLDTAMPLSLDL